MAAEPDETSTSGRVRQPILYADQMWRQQRFFAAFLVVVGAVMTVILVVNGQLFRSSNFIWLLYVPSGLLLGGAFLYYKWRSYVEAEDAGLRFSTLFSSVLIDYDKIRLVKVQPLNVAFQDKRSRMIARAMKPLLEKPALFVRLRGDEDEVAAIVKQLGSRIAYDDTIAVPVPDADAAAWSISAHLPERIGQNLGGGKRRKRRR
ncbi:MAG TPA: hypothetical protein VFB69_01510 [Candidatus Dormibacteraeota bacterium]|nr:hypothetical protein [Candidatus Dormibacteraeota bacterium]